MSNNRSLDIRQHRDEGLQCGQTTTSDGFKSMARYTDINTMLAKGTAGGSSEISA